MGTLTFLFVDIESSTALLGRLGEESYSEALADYRHFVRAGLAAHGGREIDTQGDGLFAVFSSPSACTAAVIEMQLALQSHSWPAGEVVRARMGLHVGEASETPTGLVGLALHRAARVAAVAHGGQVVLSEAAAVLVREALPPGASLRSLGAHRLKDLGHPEHIFQLEAPGLRADFPALRSLDNPALHHNLPGQLTSFIGRDRELFELRNLVGTSRLVTLTGPGGSGKTRLALQVAAELLDGSSDGVWFVDLAPLDDPGLVAGAVASALKVREEPGQSLTETLCFSLAEQSLLLVLDNCEHVIDACAKLVDALVRACPQVHVIATSREPLAIQGEHVHRVPPLSVPHGETDSAEVLTSEAAMLFCERARAHQDGFVLDGATCAAVASICQRLDGIPLAIELAAARMRAMSATEIADRLRDRFRLLTGGDRTAVRRHQTLQTLIDWSYALLNGPERTVLARLSVFAGGFDLVAAEAVASAGDVEPFAVVDLVASLVDKSLVQAEVLPTGRSRYRLLETVREYAGARLAAQAVEEEQTPGNRKQQSSSGGAARDNDSDVLATRWRHGVYFLALAEELAPSLRKASQLEALDRLNLEIDNLRGALETFQEHGPAEMLRLMIALSWYWVLRGQLNESRAWYDSAPVGDPALDPDVRAELITLATMSQLFAGDLEGATSKVGHLEQASAACRDRGRWGSWETTLAAFTRIHEPVALPMVRDGTERLLRYENPWGMGAALTLRGEVERIAGNISMAKSLYQQALALFEQEGDRFWLSVNVLNLGECAVQVGEYESAVPLLSSILPALRELGNDFMITYCSIAMGCAAAGLGQSRAAGRLLGAALGWLERRGMPLEPVEQTMADNAVLGLRTAVGDAALEELLHAGRLMRPEEALDHYLHKGDGTE